MITLRSAVANYPHVAALKSGAVATPEIAFDWENVEPITCVFRRQVRTGDFDLCEIALASHAQARAHGKPITALPVVVMRGFHHAALVCPRDSPLRGPRDLLGKRVGVRAYSQTTGLWLRGILREQYDVDHRAITWVTAEDAHVAEYSDPPNVTRIAPGQDLAAMLLAGEIDAGIALAGLDPALARPVIADPEAEAARWYMNAGAYPVNHIICVRESLLAADPTLGATLFRLFTDAKAAATESSAEARYRDLLGGDPLPYGFAANRRGAERCLRYAAEQGLSRACFSPRSCSHRFERRRGTGRETPARPYARNRPAHGRTRPRTGRRHGPPQHRSKPARRRVRARPGWAPPHQSSTPTRRNRPGRHRARRPCRPVRRRAAVPGRASAGPPADTGSDARPPCAAPANQS